MVILCLLHCALLHQKKRNHFATKIVVKELRREGHTSSVKAATYDTITKSTKGFFLNNIKRKINIFVLCVKLFCILKAKIQPQSLLKLYPHVILFQTCEIYLFQTVQQNTNGH
jgi:hypothetical protein